MRIKINMDTALVKKGSMEPLVHQTTSRTNVIPFERKINALVLMRTTALSA
jgi:hypothetical protein